MSINKTIVALFSVVCVSANAQMNYPMYSDSSLTQSAIEVDGNVDYLASAIYRDMSHTLIFGGMIDDGMKSHSFDRHTLINRAGFNLGTEIRYIHGKGRLLKRDTVTWMVKGGYFGVGSLVYGSDVFGLLFYGNSAYRGNSADLTGTRLDYTIFQKIGFGIVSKKNRSSVTLNLINVQQHAAGLIQSGSLVQNEDGSEVELDLRGEFRSTKGKQFNQGIGLAVDLDYRMRVKWGQSFTTFQLATQNLGFAYMYNGMTRYRVDSTYNYSGFEMEQLTSGSSVFGPGFSIMDSLNIDQTTYKKAIALPGYVQAMKLVDLESSKKVQSFFGFRLYPTLNTVPSLFAGAYWKASERFHASASLSYGGSGLVRGGLYATVRGKKFSWMAGTDDLIGTISKYGFGQSLVTRLLWKFN